MRTLNEIVETMTGTIGLLTRMLAMLAVVALGFSACAGASMQEGASSSQVAATAEEGAEIWRTTCYRCHNRRPATEFTEEQWPVIVDHMRTRAHLTRAEAEAVTAFLRELAASS